MINYCIKQSRYRMVNEPFLKWLSLRRRLFVTHLVQARNLLTHFLLLESIAHASSRRQQQRTCTLVVALTFRSWPQVSFFTGARPQKMLMLESTRLNRLKGSHSFFVYIFPSLSLLLFQINTVRWHQCGLDCPSLPAGLGGNGEFGRKMRNFEWN